VTVRRGRLILAAAVSGTLALSGCAVSVDFRSPGPLGTGVTGKSWQLPRYVDAEVFTPSGQSQPNLVIDFDAAVSGTSAQLVGTWVDPTTGIYKGYGRLYQDSSGWSDLGASFGQIASDGANSLAYCSAAGGPDGLFMANFLSLSTAGHGASAAYSGGSWTIHTNNTALTTIPAPTYATSANLTSGPQVTSVMDSSGRGFVFFADAAGVWEGQWALATSTGLSPALNAASSGAISSNSGLTARFDGVNRVCVTYELGAGPALKATCQNVSSAGAFTFDPSSAETIQAINVAGHESATDGAGKIMVVYYAGTGTSFHVYASLGASGAWSAAGTQIDAAMASGYVAPSPSGSTQITGARPGVAYVGNGQYLAVWAGINASSKTTQLYSSFYDPTTGWSAAAAIPETLEQYTSLPHHQSIHVFGNGDGNAGYAANKVYTDSLYAEANGVRVTEVARWQIDEGWLEPEAFGNFCYNASGVADATCNRRPTGVMLPSGNTLVFFQDRDNSGNRRLAVVEFM
jgi:hypothetical protein